MFVCAILSVLSSTRIHPNSSSTTNNNNMNAKQKKDGIAAIVYCFQYKVSDFLRSLSLLCWAHTKKHLYSLFGNIVPPKAQTFISEWNGERERHRAHENCICFHEALFLLSVCLCSYCYSACTSFGCQTLPFYGSEKQFKYKNRNRSTKKYSEWIRIRNTEMNQWEENVCQSRNEKCIDSNDTMPRFVLCRFDRLERRRKKAREAKGGDWSATVNNSHIHTAHKTHREHIFSIKHTRTHIHIIYVSNSMLFSSSFRFVSINSSSLA